MTNPVVRALLASAALAAAIALAGCNAEDIAPTGRAMAPLSPKTAAEVQAKNMDPNSPILIRLFKEEAELEMWKQNRDGQYALLKTYPICRWSGDLGPKKKQGDRQAPEGFYTITPGLMNPNSNYYLAFNTGFPNAYDRSHGYTGSDLMVHGDCSSRGCYAMTDEQIQEIYALARESFFGGQKEFQFEAFPFRMTALNMAKHRNNPNFAFWKMIKEGYDDFEATRQEPKVAVCEKHYVFDAAAPDGSTKPLRFDPRGKCPAYQLDRNVADAVLDHRRAEQFKMAQYIANDVPTVPPHVGDGGMNPVFAGQLAAHNQYDDVGHVTLVAGNEQAPGALPHVPNPPGAYAALHPPKTPPKPATQPASAPTASPAAEPTMMASVPVPPAAPLPKEGETPPPRDTTLAGLFGNLFGGARSEPQSPPEAAADAPEAESTLPAASAPVELRGSTVVAAAKPKAAPAIRTAAAPAPRPKPYVPPKAVAVATPKAQVAQAEKKTARSEKKEQQNETQGATTASEIRTAYSAPQSRTNGLLAGAQPVLQAGSFESRWAGLR